MIVAVIDLGTNTFHLIIAAVDAGLMRILHKETVAVQLGRNRINENIITGEAFTQGIDTLVCFRELMDSYGIVKVRAVATSAIRNALNGQQFVSEAAAKAGIHLEVISGLIEAELIYAGVRATGIIDATALTIDIGGGSTEFIIGNNQKILWKNSYDIGAARLQQAFFRSDPISADDHLAILRHIESVTSDLEKACEEHRPRLMIGSAGAFETFAALLYPEDTSPAAAKELDMGRFRSVSQWLMTSTHQERANTKEIIPLRVDMIVMATILTNYVIDMVKPDRFYLSAYDMKMGMLYTMIDGN
ncbi:Ppx/GppA phosphatase family protein [Pedobacter deserti]|uniref:Ppx/GppA phosphatase family protein n=1 Tax=Pedobacter deserti TaxID=2817382 RepID=UPI00210EE523|nr:exopolyphosphatase [Pedobacter sp. SYSU D00382]